MGIGNIMSAMRFVWLLQCAIQCLVYGNVAGGIKGRLMVPLAYTAGDSDLRVQLQMVGGLTSSTSSSSSSSSNTTTRLPATNASSSSSSTSVILGGGAATTTPTIPAPNQLRISSVVPASRDNGFVAQKTTVATLYIYPDPFSNVTQIVIPCQHLSQGGLYELEVLQDDVEQGDERLRQQLDVRWPAVRMTVTPESIVTYPEHSVDVILEFPNVQCGADEKSSEDLSLPEFWIELFYCGHDVYCTTTSSSSSPSTAMSPHTHQNTTTSPTLYAELVRGFPHHRLIQLRCELFGLAGNYAVKLRAANKSSTFIGQTAFIKVDWSDKFVFNVHARSIFPCDNMGIGVLFEYPACILDHGDRVRVFGKLRADVFSLVPPTTLHYISERRVVRGQHSLHFDCELFSEKYVEYCFVYVSQAISGAVADVRMDCVPTLPVNDVDTAGGWGPWSEWTPCSSTCADGTRNRYRFCDSPPPRYGAKFCEGPAVQMERCGLVLTEAHLQNISSDCLYGSLGLATGEIPADRPEVVAEIGPGCRCGCIVHLSNEKPRRLIASSSKSCPGRTFWLIQADNSHQIRMKLDFLRLPCSTQYLKVRDGDSLGAQLVVEYEGGTFERPKQEVAVSTNSQILIEFFSDELAILGDSCGGGFLVHVQQIPVLEPPSNFTYISLMPVRSKINALTVNLTIAHIIAILFVALIVLISLLLGTQYIFRYRKYQRAAGLGEPDSPAQTPRASLGSLLVPGRAMSTSTLVSDVISLVKLRPRLVTKHARLRESVDPETFEKCHSPDEHTDQNLSASPNVTTDEDEEGPKTLSDDGDSKSLDSVQTLTNEGLEESDKSGTKVEVESEVHKRAPKETRSRKGNLEKAKDVSDLLELKRADPRMIELREMKANGSSIESLETSSCVGGVSKSRDNRSSNPLLHKLQGRQLSVSQQTLTNANYSPALSLSRKAKIRTTTEKESKEKRNLETLLNRPGSEFSLTNPEDMEMDYYDYNVTNASAAPGSYFSISHLMWIPSLLQEDFDAEQNRIEEDEDEDDEENGARESGQFKDANMRGDEGIDLDSSSVSPDSEVMQLQCPSAAVAKHNNLGCAISMPSEDEADTKSDAEQEKDNKTTEKKQLASSQYYKNYYDQMDIQFADEEAEEEAAV